MDRLTKRIIVVAALMLVGLFGLATVTLPSGSASAVRQPEANPGYLPVGPQCPPVTTINGILGSGSMDYPATSGVQTGRILNGLGNNACGGSNPCSLNTATGSRAFDAYTFIDTGSATECVTVNFTLDGCSSNASLQYSARLGSFDPANPCVNYVGDAGAGFGGPNNSGSFSFNVPAGQTFVVVVNETDPGESVGCAYTLTISGLSCQVSCPPATITGDIGQGSTDYPSTTGVQTGRVSQNGVDSTCAAPKTCPGIASAGLPFTFDSYQFFNNTSTAACVTFTFPMACGPNNAFHPVAYLGSFDPANPCTNYLGDIGHSINNSESGAFSVNVPANSTVVLVLHETGTQPGCQGYSFSVTGLPCQQPCAITCPSNITQPNDPNQCGAVVDFSAPTTSGNCGVVTCVPASGSFFPVGTTTVTCTPTTGSNCTFTVTIQDTQAPAITCPANIVKSNDPNQCGAVVTYTTPTPTDNCGGATASCSPLSGSFFPVGVTTVTCTASDASPDSPNATCTFTVTVNDTQPPAITCPANQTAVTNQNACPSPACQVVNFTTPTASDNCPGAGVVCNPPGGSCFPVGVTTVTCTTTDASGNTATCSFTVTTFDVALQDDSNPSTILLWNSITGQYRFCCNGTTYTGVGTATRKGCVYTLQTPTANNRRVLGKHDKAVHSGSGSLQSPPGQIRCTITDRNTLNDTLLPACQ